jgi:hypothetical protein
MAQLAKTVTILLENNIVQERFWNAQCAKVGCAGSCQICKPSNLSSQSTEQGCKMQDASGKVAGCKWQVADSK